MPLSHLTKFVLNCGQYYPESDTGFEWKVHFFYLGDTGKIVWHIIFLIQWFDIGTLQDADTSFVGDYVSKLLVQIRIYLKMGMFKNRLRTISSVMTHIIVLHIATSYRYHIYFCVMSTAFMILYYIYYVQLFTILCVNDNSSFWNRTVAFVFVASIALIALS